MLSRREVLIGAAAAGAAALVRGGTTAIASASQPSTPVNFDVPAGACDTHTHVFGDPQRFPFGAARAYTPEPASVAEMRVLHSALHTDRVVVVHPSVYGTDNSCTLEGMRQLGSIARGIAVIDEKTPESALDEMDRAGMRGIRVNLETMGQSDPAVARQRFQEAVDRIKRRGKWHIQVYTRLSVIEGIKDQVQQRIDAGCVRPLRRGASGARRHPARLRYAAEPGPDGQSVRQNFGAVPEFHAPAGLRGRRAAGEGADWRESATHFVGKRLATSGVARGPPPGH